MIFVSVDFGAGLGDLCQQLIAATGPGVGIADDSTGMIDRFVGAPVVAPVQSINWRGSDDHFDESITRGVPDVSIGIPILIDRLLENGPDGLIRQQIYALGDFVDHPDFALRLELIMTGVDKSELIGHFNTSGRESRAIRDEGVDSPIGSFVKNGPGVDFQFVLERPLPAKLRGRLLLNTKIFTAQDKRQSAGFNGEINKAVFVKATPVLDDNGDGAFKRGGRLCRIPLGGTRAGAAGISA